MTYQIFIFTNDNVLFLLLENFIKSIDNNIICKKLLQQNELIDKGEASLIIVDGKMMQVSPISLIYELRYRHKIVTPIWIFNEIQIQTYIDKVIEVGANKIIDKPFNPFEIAKDVVNFVHYNIEMDLK